jgi:PAS domain S-box-containing protein
MLIGNIKDYAVITLDRLGHVTSWNGAAERINGYPAEEVIGRNVSLSTRPAT